MNFINTWEDKNKKQQERQITNKGMPIRLTAAFSAETLRARSAWHGIFKVMKEKKPTTKNTIPSKPFIQI